MTRKAATSLLTTALALALHAPVSADRPASSDSGLPTIQGPVAQTEQSYAFNAAAHTKVPQDLAAHGYIEEEYLLSGSGRIYDFPNVDNLRVLGSGPYVTRILVRRPGGASRFSGAVVVEPLNPSHMADADLMWILSRDHFMREGIAWIGVTIKPVAGDALKRFNSDRYGSISFANPLPAKNRCPDLERGRTASDTEVGFAFDILSQLAALIRSNGPGNPLAELKPSRIYLTGYSQTAGLARGYAVAVARGRGTPLYDGYVYGGHGPFNVLFNNCDTLNLPGDERLMPLPVGVPIIDVAVEGDVPVSHFMRKPDSDTWPDLFRRYEIAGATHTGSLFEPFTPRAEDFARAHGSKTSTAECLPADPPLSHFALDHTFNAVWQNLELWVRDGISPPRAPLLRLTTGGERPGVVQDDVGNALDGVRSVAVDVPTTKWHGTRGGAPRCMRTGYAEPLDQRTLRVLYPSHSAYVGNVAAAANRLVEARWLTPADARSIIDAAWRAPAGFPED